MKLMHRTLYMLTSRIKKQGLKPLPKINTQMVNLILNHYKPNKFKHINLNNTVWLTLKYDVVNRGVLGIGNTKLEKLDQRSKVFSWIEVDTKDLNKKNIYVATNIKPLDYIQDKLIESKYIGYTGIRETLTDDEKKEILSDLTQDNKIKSKAIQYWNSIKPYSWLQMYYAIHIKKPNYKAMEILHLGEINPDKLKIIERKQ